MKHTWNGAKLSAFMPPVHGAIVLIPGVGKQVEPAFRLETVVSVFLGFRPLYQIE